MMPPRFFRLSDDVHARRRWHLSTPVDAQGRKLNDWDFKRGTPVRIEGRVRVPIGSAGRPLDFTEAGVRIPVVHARVAALLTKLASDDIQLIPAEIDGQPEQYFILVATRLIRCIDEQNSKVQLWTPEDGVPDKVGTYYAVDDLRIAKAAVGQAKVFRPEGWEVTLVISDDIKDAMERVGVTGARFEEV